MCQGSTWKKKKTKFKCAEGALKNKLPGLKEESGTWNIFLLIGEILSKEEVLLEGSIKKGKKAKKKQKRAGIEAENRKTMEISSGQRYSQNNKFHLNFC